MDKLSLKYKLGRSQSMGVGVGLEGIFGSLEENKTASIVLLDERRLDVIIHPRLVGGELLDSISSQIHLKEKEYFGLAFLDDFGATNWLNLERRVLDHDYPKKSPLSPLVIHFLVKFFIESFSHLAHSSTVELFYLQSRSLIFRGILRVEADLVFRLGALGLQVSYSDYSSDSHARAHIRKSPILPSFILKDFGSSVAENRVIDYYKGLLGQSRGEAIVNYMRLVEAVPSYGVHYFDVFDKKQIPWSLGLSCAGIAQYSCTDKMTPVRVFPWKQLENLYFRDNKFSIEVHDGKRVIQTASSFSTVKALQEENQRLEIPEKELLEALSESTTRVSTSRRSFSPGTLAVYVWFGQSSGLTKSIWQSAIAQHQFYLDRKTALLRISLTPIRSTSEIVRDLNKSKGTFHFSSSASSTSSTSSLSNLSRVSSHSNNSLPCPSSSSLSLENEETKRARFEMLSALKARREALESQLKEKNNLYKDICIKEGELTGRLPPDTPHSPGESLPCIRRRIGTEFTFNSERLSRNFFSNDEEEALANLELEREIQSQITNAALKISSDPSACKSVKKQRRVSYLESQRKLKDIESQLKALKVKVRESRGRHEGAIRRGLSVPDLERGAERREGIETVNGKEKERNEIDGRRVRENNEGFKTPFKNMVSSLSPRSCPSSPKKTSSSSHTPLDFLIKSSQMTTESSPMTLRYISQISPKFSASPYRNKFEVTCGLDSPLGLYNIPQQRTSEAFSSLEQLNEVTMSRHGGSPIRRLEAAAGNYPSLERSARKKSSVLKVSEELSRGSLEDLRQFTERSNAHLSESQISPWSTIDIGGPYPNPFPNSNTLLPSQTYPESPGVRLDQDGLVILPSKKREVERDEKDSPPPLYPKQYHQVIEKRRRSLLTPLESSSSSVVSPAVNRRMKPPLVGTSELSPAPPPPAPEPPKYVPYRETTKPFEMSDFYKYSTKFRKASASSLKSAESESSDRSSITSIGSSAAPPEIPARSFLPPHSPVQHSSSSLKTEVPTLTSASTASSSSVADAFSSEMLAWYNTQKSTTHQTTPLTSSTFQKLQQSKNNNINHHHQFNNNNNTHHTSSIKNNNISCNSQCSSTSSSSSSTSNSSSSNNNSSSSSTKSATLV